MTMINMFILWKWYPYLAVNERNQTTVLGVNMLGKEMIILSVNIGLHPYSWKTWLFSINSRDLINLAFSTENILVCLSLVQFQLYQNYSEIDIIVKFV